jgi:hypothetical protein
MNVKEIIDNIHFDCGSTDDTSGRSINALFTNKQIVSKLNMELNKYARITKGIQDIYTFPMDSTRPFIPAPKLALRSEPYQFIMLYVNNMAFPLDMKGVRDAFNTYRYRPLNGISNWVVPWSRGKEQFLSVFPTNVTKPATCVLAVDITKKDKTIPVTMDKGSLLMQEGYATIGNEKIFYRYHDKKNLYDCERGIEDTEPEAHNANEIVTQNNMIIFYSRLPKKVECQSDDYFTQAELSREIEICDEHMQGIIMATVYSLLLKIPNSKATNFKVDSDDLYSQYKEEIKAGYYRNNYLNIRNPYMNEADVDYSVLY